MGRRKSQTTPKGSTARRSREAAKPAAPRRDSPTAAPPSRSPRAEVLPALQAARVVAGAALFLAAVLFAGWSNGAALAQDLWAGRARKLGASRDAATRAEAAESAKRAAAMPVLDPMAGYSAFRALGSSKEAAALAGPLAKVFGHEPVLARWRLLSRAEQPDALVEAARLAALLSPQPRSQAGSTTYAAGASLFAAEEQSEAFRLFLRGLSFREDYRPALALAEYAHAAGLASARWRLLERSLGAGGDAAVLLGAAEPWAEDGQGAEARRSFVESALRRGDIVAEARRRFEALRDAPASGAAGPSKE